MIPWTLEQREAVAMATFKVEMVMNGRSGLCDRDYRALWQVSNLLRDVLDDVPRASCMPDPAPPDAPEGQPPRCNVNPGGGGGGGPLPGPLSPETKTGRA